MSYVGRGDGGQLYASLTPLSDGRTRAEGSVTGTGGTMCMGVFSGTGTFQGRTMQVQEENLPGCIVTLVRNGRSLTVDAGGRACVGLSGAACSLSGTLAQR